MKTPCRNPWFVRQWYRHAVSKSAVTNSGIGGLLLMLFLQGKDLFQGYFSVTLCVQALLTVVILNSVAVYSTVQVFLRKEG